MANAPARPAAAAPRPAKGGPKVLRIGVIRGGKIIDDRVFLKSRNVSVGANSRNTFVIPISDLPDTVMLFHHRGSHYELNFTDDMVGEVSTDAGAKLDLPALRTQGLAKKTGNSYLYK